MSQESYQPTSGQCPCIIRSHLKVSLVLLLKETSIYVPTRRVSSLSPHPHSAALGLCQSKN